MQFDSFKVQYLKVMQHFGAQYFTKVGAEKLWTEICELPEKEACNVFDWAIKNHSKTKPPMVEDLIRKVASIKFTEQKRLENLKTHDPDRLSNGGLEKFLQETGHSSLKDLARNNFKPKT